MPIKFAVKSLAKGLEDHWQSHDLDIYSRPQIYLKLDYLSDYILDITLKLNKTYGCHICSF